MSNSSADSSPPLPPAPQIVVPEGAVGPFTLRALTEILIRESGLTDGRWEVMFAFGIVAGNFRDATQQQSPGVLTTIGGVLLNPSAEDSPNGVDASKVKRAGSRKPKST